METSSLDKWPFFPNELGNKRKTQKACPHCGKAPLMIEYWGEEGGNKILIRITCANSVLKNCKYLPNIKPEFKSELEKGDYSPMLEFVKR